VHDACDGGGRVATDPWQRLQLGGRGRHLASVALDDRARRRVEQARAAVVPKPLPCGEDVRLGRGGEGRGTGKPRDEPLEGLDHPAHLGLLQHDLAHERPVARARIAPRKRPGGDPKPRFQRLRNALRVGNGSERTGVRERVGTGREGRADRHGTRARLPSTPRAG
jgi:hypothetical protein